MPAFGRFAFDAFARNCGIKLDHRFATFDWRIRAAGYDRPGIEKAFPRVSAGEPFHSKAGRREKQIADRVRWLHRRNYIELLESRNVGRIDDLCVLHSP